MFKKHEFVYSGVISGTFSYKQKLSFKKFYLIEATIKTRFETHNSERPDESRTRELPSRCLITIKHAIFGCLGFSVELKASLPPKH